MRFSPESERRGERILQSRKSVLRALRIGLASLALLLLPPPIQATLYVIILDRQEIAIASDGQRTIFLHGKISPASQTTEKVTRLNTKLAFMCSGLVEITTPTVDIRLSEIARTVSLKPTPEGAPPFSMNELANQFGKTIGDRLEELSPEGRNQMLALRQQLGGETSQIFECMFAGVDADGTLKTETVDVFTSSVDHGVPHFAYHSEEAVGSESPRIILSGEVAGLQTGFQDPQSPIAGLAEFRAWAEAFQRRRLDSSRTAEALLALAIKYPQQGAKQRLGYPIHVYLVNREEGFKKLKTVPEGRALGLPD